MGSTSGTSSGSSTQLSCEEEEEQQRVMEQRKRKRMLSNRESARRSRMRKQKHLDELMSHVAHLRKENHHILTTYKVTTQRYLAVETDNSVLRTQMMELTARLHSLDEILDFMNTTTISPIDGNALANNSRDNILAIDGGGGGFATGHHTWNSVSLISHPIMASPDMFLY